MCFFVPLHTVDRNRRVFIDRNNAVQMPRTADDVPFVNLRDKRVFEEQSLVGF